MEFKIAESGLILQFNPLFTLAIASLTLLLGVNIRKRSLVLEHFCLPVALIGGVFVILARTLLYFLFNIEIAFDTSTQSYFFLTFFATIGLNASVSLFKHGGVVLFYCVAACWGITVIQNIVGIGLAYLTGINPMFGVIAGSASLAGGHGSALAFGSLLEAHGIAGAEAIGVTASTFGVLAGSMFGGPVAKYLIKRNNLKIETTHSHIYSQHLGDEVKSGVIDPTRFVRMLAVVLLCMALGSWAGEIFNIWKNDSSIYILRNFRFPDYVWTMLLAVVIRNVGDATNIFKRCADSLGLILSLALRYAVVLVVMSLRMTDFRNIILALTIILVIQTLIVVLIAIYGVFPLIGRDYDAAVICAGLCGLMLGAAHSAISNISTVCEQHDKVYSHKALLVVSLCGAALVDIFMMPFSSICLNMFLDF